MILVGPFVIHKIIWLSNSRQTTGIVWFTGHTLEVQSISSHPVIRFKKGNDTVYFDGNVNLDLTPGEVVAVRYQKNDVRSAHTGLFLVNLLFPLLLLSGRFPLK